MLVHKATMGVLDRIWTGQYRLGPDGRRLPLERPARLADFPELKASEWWEVDTRTPLARKLRRYYPWVTPVTGPDGALIDVLLQHRELREAARACQQQARALEAGRRGYRQGRRVRPTGLMPFLNMEGEEKV